MQKKYVIQLYKTINKLLCNLSSAGQYMSVSLYAHIIFRYEYPVILDITKYLHVGYSGIRTIF